MNSPAPKVIAGVVLLRSDNAALLQLRDDKPGLSAAGLWVFPGGHCESGEALPACGCREFREETGYDCVHLEELASFEYRSPDTGHDFQLNFFWALYDGKQAVHCYEGQKVCFVARDEAPGLPMPPYLLPVWDLAIERAWGGPAPTANGST